MSGREPPTVETGREDPDRLGSAEYGVKTYDLSTDRADPDDYELIRLPRAKFLTPVAVPAECYLHFGSKSASAIDLRDYVGQQFSSDEPLGEVWLENPTGVSGTLRLFFGISIGVEANPEIGDISSITNTVTVTDDGSFVLDDANQGTLPVEQQTGVVIEGDDDGGNTRQIGVDKLNEALTGTEPGIISYLCTALASVADDEVRVNLEANNAGALDVSAATVTVTDDGAFNVSGTVSVQEATALDVSGATVTVDPTERTPSTATDSGTGSANAAQLDLGADGGRVAVDVFADTTGDATLTVEVAADDGAGNPSTWRTFDTFTRSGATARVERIDTAYRHIRAHLNQNRNAVELAAKGV